VGNARNSMRLFTAVELPSGLRKKLLSVAGALKGTLAGGRWVSEQQLHVTLLFLGAVDVSDLSEVQRRMADVGGELPCWRSSLSGLGAFPTPRKARVLWAGVRGGEELFDSLFKGLRETLAPFCEKVENRRYTPHVTLARFSGRPPPGVLGAVEEAADRGWGEFSVGEVTLFESRLSPRGATYAPLLRASLSKGSL